MDPTTQLSNAPITAAMGEHRACRYTEKSRRALTTAHSYGPVTFPGLIICHLAPTVEGVQRAATGTCVGGGRPSVLRDDAPDALQLGQSAGAANVAFSPRYVSDAHDEMVACRGVGYCARRGRGARSAVHREPARRTGRPPRIRLDGEWVHDLRGGGVRDRWIQHSRRRAQGLSTGESAARTTRASVRMNGDGST